MRELEQLFSDIHSPGNNEPLPSEGKAIRNRHQQNTPGYSAVTTNRSSRYPALISWSSFGFARTDRICHQVLQTLNVPRSVRRGIHNRVLCTTDVLDVKTVIHKLTPPLSLLSQEVSLRGRFQGPVVSADNEMDPK